jgi:hypothetical protein
VSGCEKAGCFWRISYPAFEAISVTPPQLPFSFGSADTHFTRIDFVRVDHIAAEAALAAKHYFVRH